MLYLRPMQEWELGAYIEHSIKAEALDYVHNYEFDLERATQVVRSQLENRLPDGVETEGHYLCSVELADGETITNHFYQIICNLLF